MDLILLLIVAFIFYALVSLRVLKQYERGVVLMRLLPRPACGETGTECFALIQFNATVL